MTGGFQNNREFDIEIKRSDPKDVEAIFELEKAVFSPKLRYGPSIILALITTSSPHLALTAFLQGTEIIIGFIAGECDLKDRELGRIITIEIDPKYQHRYIGTQLLQEIENNMKEYYSISKIELQVHSTNKTAIKFYNKHGYLKVKELRNYYARGEHALLMMKSL
jgi:ribosomal protein S18 acetylase RimI-like enzyme